MPHAGSDAGEVALGCVNQSHSYLACDELGPVVRHRRDHSGRDLAQCTSAFSYTGGVITWVSRCGPPPSRVAE